MTDFQKGQTLSLDRRVVATLSTNNWRDRTFNPGTSGEVTFVTRNTIRLRINGEVWSFNRSQLPTPNGEAWDQAAVDAAKAAKPKPRKLGETPVAAEGEEIIAINDPRIAWIWKDAAKFAESQGYCGHYDSLTEKLGIPGRVRDFRASITKNGISLVGTVKATSQKEADAKLTELLA